MNITVTAHRWSGGWELHRDSDPITQVRTLDKAAGQVRDYLDSIDPKVDHSAWTVDVVADLGGLEDDVAAARAATAAAAEATEAAARRARATVKRLRDAGVSVTDAAAILGVSRGRISQLTSV